MSHFSRANQPPSNIKPLTDAEKRKVDYDRELVRRGGLRAFIKLAWPIVEPAISYRENWHTDAMAVHLEAAYKGEIRNLLINVPPGCGKSLTTCVFGPTYAWVQQPGLAWIFASFDAGLTHRDSKHTLRLLQTPWFRNRWGDKVMVSDEAAEGEYATMQGGFRFSTSVNGKATGRHPDIVVVDDPIKPKEITKTNLEACRTWWKGTMYSRARDQATVRRICIMQRLHQDDLAGMFIDEGKWEHVRLPMRFETNSVSVTNLPWKDPRTEEGELLWPGHFPEEVVKDIEGTMGSYYVASQYQQRPSPEAGNVFLRTWFQNFNPDPKALPTFDQLCQSWDCTFKDSDGTDFVVGQVWGRKGSTFYLLDEVRRRMNFSDTVEAIREMRRKWPKVNAILIEDKANGPAVESVLSKELSGIVMVNPQGGKVSRANATQPFFEAMNVFHPDPDFSDENGRKPYYWVGQHREELANFPTGSYDDRVDACTQALIWLAEKRSAMVQAMDSLKFDMNVFS